MARQLTDGAEAGDFLIFDTTSGSPTISTSVVRIGGRSFQMNTNATAKKAITGGSELFFRFALVSQQASNQAALKWWNGATELGSIRRNASGSNSIPRICRPASWI